MQPCPASFPQNLFHLPTLLEPQPLLQPLSQPPHKGAGDDEGNDEACACWLSGSTACCCEVWCVVACAFRRLGASQGAKAIVFFQEQAGPRHTWSKGHGTHGVRATAVGRDQTHDLRCMLHLARSWSREAPAMPRGVRASISCAACRECTPRTQGPRIPCSVWCA